MFKDTPDGKTNYCKSCEIQARHGNTMLLHTCGLRNPVPAQEECNHQFWRDRNPPECMNCGKTEEELCPPAEKQEAYEQGYDACNKENEERGTLCPKCWGRGWIPIPTYPVCDCKIGKEYEEVRKESYLNPVKNVKNVKNWNKKMTCLDKILCSLGWHRYENLPCKCLYCGKVRK